MRAVLASAAAVLLWGLATAEALGDYYQRRQGPDWRTVARVLDQLVSPGDRVLASIGAEYPLRHYWRLDVESLNPARLPGLPLIAASPLWMVTVAG